MELHSPKNKPLAFSLLAQSLSFLAKMSPSLSNINLPELEPSTVQNVSRYNLKAWILENVSKKVKSIHSIKRS